MKKIISIILVLTLLASISLVFTSCDNGKKNEGGGGSAVYPPANDDKSDETGDDLPDVQDPLQAASQMIGLVGVLDAYNPEENKSYIRVDVPQFEDTVVYLISHTAIPNLTARLKNITNGTVTDVVISDWSYDEARGIYYASFNAPNAAGNAMYQFLTKINGEDSGRVFAVQVVKKMNVDPNGWV